MFDHPFVSENVDDIDPILYSPENKAELENAKKCIKKIIKNYDKYQDKLLAEFKHIVSNVENGVHADEDISLHIYAAYIFAHMCEHRVYDDVVKILCFDEAKCEEAGADYLLLPMVVSCIYDNEKNDPTKLLKILKSEDPYYTNMAGGIIALIYLIKYKEFPRDKCVVVLRQFLKKMLPKLDHEFEEIHYAMQAVYSTIVQASLHELKDEALELYKKYDLANRFDYYLEDGQYYRGLHH